MFVRATALAITLFLATPICSTAAPPTSGATTRGAIGAAKADSIVAIPASPFSADSQNASDQASGQIARQKRLNAILGRTGGLGDLYAGENDTSDLSKNALNEGDTASPLATPSPAANAPGEVSNLATERVPRTPAVNFAQVPILSPEQQAGAAFGEADRGEVGQIGGNNGMPRMDTSERNRLLQDFFGQGQQSDQGPSDLSKGISAAVRVKGIGERANRLLSQTGTSTPSTSADFSGGSFATPSNDRPMLDTERSGIEIGGPASEMFGPARERGDLEIGGPASEMFGPSRETTPGSSGFSMPDFTKLGTYGQGVGLLGSLAALFGNMTGNKDMSKAGSAAGVAGQGINFAASPSVASGIGALGAGLGLAGSAMGNKDVSTAGNMVGAGGSLYGLYSGLSQLLASQGASAGASAGAAAGGSAAASVAPEAAGAGLGLGTGAATAGVLALPAIVKMLVDTFAPDYTDYYFHRQASRDKGQAGGELARAAYGAIPTGDLPDTYGALRSELVPNDRNAMRSYLSPEAVKGAGISSGEWSQMSPQDFQTAMQYLSADPSRLNSIMGSGDLGYLDSSETPAYAGQAQDAARALIARQLGLPYLDVNGGAGYQVDPNGTPINIGQGGFDAQGQANITEDQYQSALANEQAYQAARDAWQQAHPGVQLSPWTPAYLGRQVNRQPLDWRLSGGLSDLNSNTL
jgi:hypothetical protein